MQWPRLAVGYLSIDPNNWRVADAIGHPREIVAKAWDGLSSGTGA